MYKSKRAKATAISKKVKDEVWERDKHKCIYCGSYSANPEAHVVSRQRGGLGVAKNIVTLCRPCHFKFDSGTNHERVTMKNYILSYLYEYYGEFEEKEVIYIPEWKRGLKRLKNGK